MKAPKFRYVRPESVRHALELLHEHGDGAAVLAGGQSLMPTLNMRLSQPEVLVDINRLEELGGIALDGGQVRIGALARHAEVMASPVVAEHLPLIAEAMPHVAHVAVRNRGTFGGSIALADPAAEMPACALALRATFVVESVRGRREIPADDFFTGLYETGREPDELLVETRIPSESTDHVSVFTELSRRHGDFAMAGVACHARIEDGAAADARLVYFGSEDRPILGAAAMAALRGRPWSDETADAVTAALDGDLHPMDSLHGSAALKLHLQRVLTRRALETAFARAAA